ncbi:MAG: hypothetical protein ACI83D_000204 [Planctomycetota bacterium]|jgi:hypothetical protein
MEGMKNGEFSSSGGRSSSSCLACASMFSGISSSGDWGGWLLIFTDSAWSLRSIVAESSEIIIFAGMVQNFLWVRYSIRICIRICSLLRSLPQNMPPYSCLLGNCGYVVPELRSPSYLWRDLTHCCIFQNPVPYTHNR